MFYNKKKLSCNIFQKCKYLLVILDLSMTDAKMGYTYITVYKNPEYAWNVLAWSFTVLFITWGGLY